MLTLFYAPGACSLASHIALEEAGVPFGVRKVDLAAEQQRREDYLAVNPRGLVPALVTPQGILSESPALLGYIAGLNPDARLLPEDPFARAKALSLVAYFSGTVHGVGFASMFRPARFVESADAFDAIRARGRRDVGEKYLPELEALVADREWVMDHFTVADLYPLIFRRWAARADFDMNRFPHLVAHASRVAARPGAARAIAREGVRLDG